MNKRTLDAIRALSELPEDGWEPHTWDVFLSTRAVLVEEAERVNRREARKPVRKVGGGTKARKPADGPTGATRQFVEARSRGYCEVNAYGCRMKGVHLHHRLMRSQGGGHDAGNLLNVCRPCHDLIHAEPTWAYERGWLLHRVTA